MELLEDSVDLEQLLSAVLGKDIVVPSSEHILHAAYKALRILWIRAFTARLPKQEVDQSKAPSDRNGQRGKIVDPAVANMHQQFGSPSLWGDLRFDLQLLRDGHVTEPDIVYLYGMKTEALELIVSERMVLEASWLNAYAGMRNRVDDDHYSLMRTACQRVGTAMSRVLDANIAGLNVRFPDGEKYAFNGLRFRELHSALSANLTKLRARERAFDRPLPPSHWRDATTVFNHKRVLREYI
ncbi:hypothetical protein IF1G_06605 [Cordyceps javanica]|uniref:Uncharacterized protein n=1 Tax=Cordyceps javanica TaxID=43265 RepID=A0A545VXP7_9HYPO|nr:hypothetical protein IF1G_06605 [Cordyceps javanica]TQW06466.1 hypothetical protein IF2G_05888 [Cordyceps javanica]